MPAKALRAFEKTAKSDWGEGIPLAELLARVNKVAATFLPSEAGADSRVKHRFTERSFRHYQTLGCIDPPERDGKQVVYDFRHFVQALLVRRLLWERMPSEQITSLLAGRSTEETRRMLLSGIAMVARGGDVEKSETVSDEAWRRVQVAPGIELHVRADLLKPRPKEWKELLGKLETALRRNL